MARGALVNSETGMVVAVFEASSNDPVDVWEIRDNVPHAFIPDPKAEVGDHWDGKKFSYSHVPGSITPLQARLALNAAGLRSQAEAAVAAADQDTKDLWEYSTILERSNPTLVALAQSIGLDDAALDALFLEASSL